MSEHHHHAQAIPRAVLLGAGALMLLSLGLAAGARSARSAEPEGAQAPALQTLDVRFEDRADGSIAVLDGASGREVSVVPPRSNGFVRGVLRGLFRNRKQEALGRLSIEDPQTGRRVDLDAFGATNSAAFAELLAAGRALTP